MTMTECSHIAEINCDECDKVLAFVQVIKGTLLVRGEAWCPECYQEISNDDD